MWQLSRRQLCLTRRQSKLREFIDKKVGKEKHVPRFHAIPKTATDNYVGNEVGVYPARRDIEGKVMCPWCKQTTFGGKPGIVCSVWPHHNWVYSAVNISGVEAKHSQKLVESGNAVSPLSKRHAPDEWRVNDTRRMPPDVFRPDRYFNAKDYLNASDPNRKTTPVSHKIDKWIQKYGTAETLRFDEFGQRIRRLNGYSMSTWLDPERYLLTDDGRHVVYVAGMFDEAAGAATYWGPGHQEFAPIPSVASGDSCQTAAESVAVTIAVNHAVQMGFQRIQIRLNAAASLEGLDFDHIDVEFRAIADEEDDEGLRIANDLAFEGVLQHLDNIIRAQNRA